MQEELKNAGNGFKLDPLTRDGLKLVFETERNLWDVTLDLETLEAAGDPRERVGA